MLQFTRGLSAIAELPSLESCARRQWLFSSLPVSLSGFQPSVAGAFRGPKICAVSTARGCVFLPCRFLLATLIGLELTYVLCCTPAQCTTEGHCDQSEVGRCLWLRNASSPMKGVCKGPNDELTLLTSNCPCGRASDRHYETESGQLTGSSCPFCKTAVFAAASAVSITRDSL